MPFRTKARRAFSRAPRKRAVWVNIPFGGMNFTESIGQQLLLVGEDWEAQFTGLAQERAVLRAIVGEICFSQTTAGTAGGNFFWGLYKSRTDATAVTPAFTTSGMSEFDWLRVGARATSSVVTQSATVFSSLMSQSIDIKTKRKIDSADSIWLCAQYAGDAAAPAGIASGILRFLVARD